MVIVLSGNRQPQTPMGLSSHSILLSGILGNSLIFSQNFMGFSSFSHRFPGWKSCQATCEHLKPLVLSAFLAGFEPGRRTSDCLARVSEKKANEVTCLFGHVNAVSNVFLCIYTIIHIHIILMFQVLSPPPSPSGGHGIPPKGGCVCSVFMVSPDALWYGKGIAYSEREQSINIYKLVHPNKWYLGAIG